MEAIDELRAFLGKSPSVVYPDEVLGYVDAIERDVKKKYIVLPKDADGECIHIGDTMECNGVIFNVLALSGTQVFFTDDNGEILRAGVLAIRHHKPSDVEYVLREFADIVRMQAQTSNKTVAEYAERLQLREED